MKNDVSVNIVEHIRGFMDCLCFEDKMDNPWWIMNSTVTFSTKSAWDLLRHREAEDEDMKEIWDKRLPFKLFFLLWIWKGMVPLVDLLNC